MKNILLVTLLVSCGAIQCTTETADQIISTNWAQGRKAVVAALKKANFLNDAKVMEEASANNPFALGNLAKKLSPAAQQAVEKIAKERQAALKNNRSALLAEVTAFLNK